MCTNWTIYPIIYLIWTPAQDILINHLLPFGGDMIWDLNFCWFWKKLFRARLKLMSVAVLSYNAVLPFAYFKLITFRVPSNRVISSLEGKFGTVCDTFVLVLKPLFMKISNLCKNHLLKVLTDHSNWGESSLIWSVMTNWRLGNFFYFILKGHHHKISKKPLDAA